MNLFHFQYATDPLNAKTPKRRFYNRMFILEIELLRMSHIALFIYVWKIAKLICLRQQQNAFLHCEVPV